LVFNFFLQPWILENQFKKIFDENSTTNLETYMGRKKPSKNKIRKCAVQSNLVEIYSLKKMKDLTAKLLGGEYLRASSFNRSKFLIKAQRISVGLPRKRVSRKVDERRSNLKVYRL